MRLVLAVVLSSSLAFAEPADAPLLDHPGSSVHLDAGQQAPFSGRLLSDVEHMKSEAQCADDHATVEKARDSVLLHPVALVAIVVGVAAAGVAVGFAVDRALPRR